MQCYTNVTREDGADRGDEETQTHAKTLLSTADVKQENYTASGMHIKDFTSEQLLAYTDICSNSCSNRGVPANEYWFG